MKVLDRFIDTLSLLYIYPTYSRTLQEEKSRILEKSILETKHSMRALRETLIEIYGKETTNNRKSYFRDANTLPISNSHLHLEKESVR